MKGWIKLYLCFSCFLTSFLFAGDVFLRGRFLEMDQQNQVWHIREDVFLNTNKYILQAKEMIYYKKEKKFSATGNLFLTQIKEKRKIWGETLEKNGNIKSIKGNPIKILDKEDSREILSQNLEIREDTKEKILILTGGVFIKEKKMLIRADKIIYNEETGSIDIMGNGIIEKPEDQVKIFASLIHYNEKSKKAEFPSPPLRLLRKKAEITGQKGEYDEANDLIFIENDVVYKEEKKEIQAQKMYSEKKGEEKIFYFEEKVELKEDEFLGSCDKAEFIEKQDILNLKGRVKLRDEKKDLSVESSLITVDRKQDLIYLFGSIYVRQKDKIITGNSGIYNKKDGLLSVKGNPTYRKGKDFAQAERIVLNTNTNEVSMTGNFRGNFSKEEKKEAKDGSQN